MRCYSFLNKISLEYSRQLMSCSECGRYRREKGEVLSPPSFCYRSFKFENEK